MRHRVRGRTLGRNPAHRKAMFRNMATSLICSLRADEEDPESPKVPGRIVTTEAKAKELRPYVEKLITLAKKAKPHEEDARQYATSAERGSTEWQQWRNSEEWQQWNQAIAPAVALRRRAFSILRDDEAVQILFDELAERFEDRPGGYTRVVRLAERRLGDGGQKALLEFVGERDRVQRKKTAPVVAEETAAPTVTEDEDEAAADEAEVTPGPEEGGEGAGEAEASTETEAAGEGEAPESAEEEKQE